MPRASYVNGRYVPHVQAMVHIEDRGYQFADGVYEVIGVFGGCLIDVEEHLDRLERSLSELRMVPPLGRTSLKIIVRETLRRNHVQNGKIYIQISRGVATRDHPFPAASKSSLIVTASSGSWPSLSNAKTGSAVVTGPDLRWRRCDIKSVSLLPNLLAKQTAAEAGAAELWMTDDNGFVTEGTASNAWILTSNNEIITRQADDGILAGITRQTLIRLIEREGYKLTLRAFTIEEAKAAKEAFFTSATAMVKPVISIDGDSIGKGVPGKITCKLIDLYFNHMHDTRDHYGH